MINFSNKLIEEADNQIVLPTEWFRFENGRTLINASILCYLFTAADTFGDDYRDAWAEKLNFLQFKIPDAMTDLNSNLQIFFPNP